MKRPVAVLLLLSAACASKTSAPSTLFAQDSASVLVATPPPPITDAAPPDRKPLTLRVPTKLRIERMTDTLSVSIDARARVPVLVTVGANMVVGVESQTFVYPKGNTRPDTARVGLSGAVDFDLGTDLFNAKQGGIPTPGKAYVVEVVLAVFETDVPPQHMWQPKSPKYKVLWQGTLRQSVE